MKEFLTDKWHIKLVVFPYGARAIRIYEKQEDGTWLERSNRYYGWYDILADRDYTVLCEMLREKEGENGQAA